jgi:uncharacterized membrane protein
VDLSPAHIHLMLNHIPVLAPFFLALLMIIALVRKSPETLRVALILTVLFSAATGVVFLTGEPAEEQVEEQTWFDEDRVHEHEERAEAGLIAAVATGALALLALLLARKGTPVKPAMAALVLAGILACAGIFGWTALAGGEIRHEEVRPGGSSVEV